MSHHPRQRPDQDAPPRRSSRTLSTRSETMIWGTLPESHRTMHLWDDISNIFGSIGETLRTRSGGAERDQGTKNSTAMYTGWAVWIANTESAGRTSRAGSLGHAATAQRRRGIR